MKVIYTIHRYDVSIFTWVTRRKTLNTLAKAARIVSKTADGPLYLLLALALFFGGAEPQHSLLHTFLIAFAIERPIYLALKNIFRRNRPPVALNIQGFVIPSDRFSFPSGHTSGAFLIATLISVFYPAWIMPLLIWATLVGLSRVVLGVHFPTDTLVGAFMGSGLALLALQIPV